MSKLVLFGTGRGADVAFRYLKRDGDHEICGFTLDAAYLKRTTFHDLPVVPFEEVETRFPPDDYRMLILLGYQEMNQLRARKYLQAKAKGYTLASYVSSDIFRPEELSVGENCFILDNQSICLDVKIGNNVVMWSSNHAGDLSVIHDHAWISSHVTIAAEVTVGESCFLGIGAFISNNVKLAKNTFVGANALITSDTKEGGVYVCSEQKELGVDSVDFMRIIHASRKL